MSEYSNHNPDVLSCLASLSNDEVFTPPQIVNQILDQLPSELWSNPNVTFLDPCCKSGVFLREIAKRLNNGLVSKIPDLQERINHICEKQLFGIAITELTALLSRRSLYCSKFANGEYSICTGDFSEQGNVIFEPMKHIWRKNGNCQFCGANRDNYNRPDDLESHAYQFIHIDDPRELFKMKFDVIIGNPPYQLETGGSGRQAKPIYNLFVDQAKSLNPNYLVMIIPSRWFAGGMGLDKFRDSMLSDGKIKKIVDYSNGKDVFPNNSVGGVCYFIWDRQYNGPCNFVNVRNDITSESIRKLDEYPVLIRYNQAIDIVRKISVFNEPKISSVVSSISPFGIPTMVRGELNESERNNIALHSSKGVGYISLNDVQKGHNLLNKWKLMISQTSAEHAGEPRKDGKFGIISGSMKVLGPNEVCTHSYLTLGPYDNKLIVENLECYLKTKFSRFLILQALSSIHLKSDTFMFLPIQDFTKKWSDEELYKKYSLTLDEIEFIESMIKSFDGEDE